MFNMHGFRFNDLMLYISISTVNVFPIPVMQYSLCMVLLSKTLFDDKTGLDPFAVPQMLIMAVGNIFGLGVLKFSV